jgi:hypothetical protein
MPYAPTIRFRTDATGPDTLSHADRLLFAMQAQRLRYQREVLTRRLRTLADPRLAVAAHPFWAVGIAAATGYLLASGPKASPGPAPVPALPPPGPLPHTQTAAVASTRTAPGPAPAASPGRWPGAVAPHHAASAPRPSFPTLDEVRTTLRAWIIGHISRWLAEHVAGVHRF